MKKTITLLLACLCSILFTHAQLHKPLSSVESFSDSISLIVQDFRKNYSTIQGNQLQSQGEMDIYRSKVTIPGALHCSILRFHSEEDSTASWQAIMYEGASYETALKIYKATFQRLKKSKIRWVNQSDISFNGKLELPGDNASFSVTPLKLNVPDEYYQRFFGEIELTNNYSGWEVHLNLHNKPDDASEYF